MKNKANKNSSIIENITYLFEVYICAFFIYIIQQTLSTSDIIKNLIVHLNTNNLWDLTFSSLIDVCTPLINQNIIFSIIDIILSIISIIFIKFIILKTENKLNYYITFNIIGIWVIIPLVYYLIYVNNTQLVITLFNIPQSSLEYLTNSYVYLDNFKYASNTFLFIFKILTVVFSLIVVTSSIKFLNSYIIKSKNKNTKLIQKLFMSLLIIPIIVFRELDIIFPTIKYYTYSTGNVGLGFGGTGIIGLPFMLEPYDVISWLLIISFYFSIIVYNFKSINENNFNKKTIIKKSVRKKR